MSEFFQSIEEAFKNELTKMATEILVNKAFDGSRVGQVVDNDEVSDIVKCLRAAADRLEKDPDNAVGVFFTFAEVVTSDEGSKGVGITNIVCGNNDMVAANYLLGKEVGSKALNLYSSTENEDSQSDKVENFVKH